MDFPPFRAVVTTRREFCYEYLPGAFHSPKLPTRSVCGAKPKASATSSKSLASYRECASENTVRGGSMFERSTSDRGDLKEVQSKFRAMEFESISSWNQRLAMNVR